MLQLVTIDGTSRVIVSAEQMTVYRQFMDLKPEELESFRRLLELGPERIRALLELADDLVEAEETMHAAPPLPPVQDGRVEWTIACRPRHIAALRGDDQPSCAWERDTCGFRCRQCAGWIGDDTERGRFLTACFGVGSGSQPDPE